MKASALLSLTGASVIRYLANALIGCHFLAKIITPDNGRLIVFERIIVPVSGWPIGRDPA